MRKWKNAIPLMNQAGKRARNTPGCRQNTGINKATLFKAWLGEEWITGRSAIFHIAEQFDGCVSIRGIDDHVLRGNRRFPGLTRFIEEFMNDKAGSDAV